MIKEAARPSLARVAAGSAAIAISGFVGLAQLAGSLVDVLDGDSADPSVWICAAIGVACLVAIPLIFRWSGNNG